MRGEHHDGDRGGDQGRGEMRGEHHDGDRGGDQGRGEMRGEHHDGDRGGDQGRGEMRGAMINDGGFGANSGADAEAAQAEKKAAAIAECLSEGSSDERVAYCDENWQSFVH